MSAKRCLFVGLGGIGQRHLRNLRTLCGDEMEVVAYRVRGEQEVLNDSLGVVTGESLDQRYGLRVALDLDQALELAPDIVFVANPSSLHVPVALAAARRGSHLFIEKPLAASWEGVEELAAEVDRRGLVAFVAYQWRFHPAFERLRGWLSEHRLGRVLFARAEVGEYLPGFHPYEDYRRMYAARRELGGGVVLSQIHEIDYLSALFGEPRRVFSLGGRLSSLEIDVDDVALSTLEFARLDGSVLPAHLEQDYVQRPRRRFCSVVGERGKIDWDLGKGTLVRYGERGELCESHDFADYPRNQPYLDELAHFLDCVERREAPRVTLRDAMGSLGVALALLESQLTGVPVVPKGRL